MSQIIIGHPVVNKQTYISLTVGILRNPPEGFPYRIDFKFLVSGLKGIREISLYTGILPDNEDAISIRKLIGEYLRKLYPDDHVKIAWG